MVLPDHKTVIGLDQTWKRLVIDNITDPDFEPVTFGNHKKDINTLVYIEKSKMLLVGGDDNIVVQYKIVSGHDQAKASGAVVKKYTEIKIGDITSSAAIGHLAFFGGYDTSLVKIIDTLDHRPLEGVYKTAIQRIWSMKICRVSAEQVLLSIAGSRPNYTEAQTDILDISDLLKQHKLMRDCALSESDSNASTDQSTQEPNFTLAETVVQTVLSKIEHHLFSMMNNLAFNLMALITENGMLYIWTRL